MPRIFISYRREDSAASTRLLVKELCDHFGEHNIFLDLVSMLPGALWQTEIDKALKRSDVMLVIIGSKWVSSRLFAEIDFVRYEIEQGLKSSGIFIIPVLVEGAVFPNPNELPESIRGLAAHNAIPLQDKSFRQFYDYSIELLVDAINHRGQKNYFAKLIVERANQLFHRDRECELIINEKSFGSIANGDSIEVLLDPTNYTVKVIFTFEAMTSTKDGVEVKYYKWPQEKESQKVLITLKTGQICKMKCGVHDLLAMADRGFIFAPFIQTLGINDVYLTQI